MNAEQKSRKSLIQHLFGGPPAPVEPVQPERAGYSVLHSKPWHVVRDGPLTYIMSGEPGYRKHIATVVPSETQFANMLAASPEMFSVLICALVRMQAGLDALRTAGRQTHVEEEIIQRGWAIAAKAGVFKS